MISLSTPRSRKSPHACGVDDDAPPQVPNVVPSMGHFNQALLDHFWRAPKLRNARVPKQTRLESLASSFRSQVRAVFQSRLTVRLETDNAAAISSMAKPE